MADPWKQEHPHQQKAPKFHLAVINVLLIVIVILIGIYLYKSYEFNTLKEDTSDIQDKMDQKDAQVKQLQSDLDKQKAQSAKDTAKLPVYLGEINKLNISLKDLNRTMETFEEGQRAVKYACISSTECRDIYINLSLNVFLASKSLQGQLLSIDKSLDYNQFMLSPVETINSTFVELNFIKDKCNNRWYDIPGLPVSRYSFRLTTDTNKRIQVVMNEKSADILCSWMIDDPTAAYTLIS